MWLWGEKEFDEGWHWGLSPSIQARKEGKGRKTAKKIAKNPKIGNKTNILSSLEASAWPEDRSQAERDLMLYVTTVVWSLWVIWGCCNAKNRFTNRVSPMMIYQSEGLSQNCIVCHWKYENDRYDLLQMPCPYVANPISCYSVWPGFNWVRPVPPLIRLGNRR